MEIQYVKSKFVPPIYHEWYEKLTKVNGPSDNENNPCSASEDDE